MDTRPFLGLDPGWYEDVSDSGLIRYWDGSRVTGEKHRHGAQWVDWWLASDGAFYPPEAHPAAIPADPAPSVETMGDILVASSGAQARPSTPPRRRRHGTRAALGAAGAAVVLVAGLVVALGGQSNAEATVLGAVDSTMADGTAHLTFNLTGGAGGATINATGTGQIDFTQNALQMDLSMVAGGQSIDLQAVYLGGTVYEGLPQIAQIEPGKSWVSLDLASITSPAGIGGSGALSVQGNPAQMLRMLTEQGNFATSIGSSTIGGVSVQGYDVTISADKIRTELAAADIPVDIGIKALDYKVYIDSQGLLRRTTISMGVSAQGVTVTMNESLDFTDYGTPVDVTAPPADQVVSFQQFAQDAGQAAG